MAKVLEGMGERFAQMEDGLKRAITRSMLEHRHSYKQGQYQ
jgi:hypothetical protein